MTFSFRAHTPPFTFHKIALTFWGIPQYRLSGQTYSSVEETEGQVQEQPAHKLAIPLFLLTSLPYFGALLYDHFSGWQMDKTFAWFGAFYLALSGLYAIKKLLNRQTNQNTI